MRKFLIPVLMSGTLMLGGCAYGLGGGLGGIFGDDGYGYNSNSDFERAAVNACGREASRYGRVSISYVQQDSRDTVRVDGRIQARDNDRDEFRCIFRSDGRIVDFDLD